MDLEALSYFGQILESGSFSAAARVLGIPRQRVHRRVTALERDLGVRLLDRSTRKMRLTDAGRRMEPHATRVLEEGRAARASLRGVKEHPSGTLRVTTTPLFAELVLSHAIQEFLSAWPEVRVEAVFSMDAEPLLERDFDLAIRFGPLEDSSLMAKPLGHAQLIWVASPSYLQGSVMPKSLDDLVDHHLLAFNSRPGREREWSWLRTASGKRLQPRLSCSLERVAMDACLEGLGLAQLPYVLCQVPIADGNLIEVMPDLRSPALPFHAVYSGRIQGNPTLNAFLETVEAHLSKTQWCLPD
ncbi:MAG: hypothetical protein COA70_01095 [Planctomycetota bacterium]|nr:MAG: hypothetical protein COA70_01095 [Planctomycetota bacterium]